MVPKSERFEMRLDPATIDRIDAWRDRQGDLPSRAEAIRRLIDMGLSRTTAEGFHLTDGEKLTTWLLTEILKHQKGYPDQKMVDLLQDAISGGHHWAIRWKLSGVLHNHVDSPISLRETIDFMDMWSFIEEALESLSTADLGSLTSAIGPHYQKTFTGFCGNTENEHIGIARFLVENMERFSRFEGRDFNAHFPTLDRYRRMFSIFDTIRPKLIGRRLSVDELVKVLGQPRSTS